MNGHAPPASYLEHLEAFQKRQKQDADFITEVIRNYEELQIKYAEKCDDYNNEVASRRMWQSKASCHERALIEQKQVSVSSDCSESRPMFESRNGIPKLVDRVADSL